MSTPALDFGTVAEWGTPPFELVIDGDVARGRGVSDDKGPVYIALQTARAFIAQEGALPLNVKFLLEGKEEIGSPRLADYVTSRPDELAADLVISADGAMQRNIRREGMRAREVLLRQLAAEGGPR